jgi:hypothetical protein
VKLKGSSDNAAREERSWNMRIVEMARRRQWTRRTKVETKMEMQNAEIEKPKNLRAAGSVVATSGFRPHSSVGVFPGQCFFDRVAINVFAKRRKQKSEDVVVLKNLPIGARWRPYARLARGYLTVTQNPVDFYYGKFDANKSRGARISPCRLSMRSNRTPLTFAELSSAIDAFVHRGSRKEVGLVELSFDTNLCFGNVCRDLFTSARYRRDCESGRWKTIYVGSPRSHWQVRIYEKISGITRVEFVLRTRALRSLGVEQAHELLRLRTADLFELVSWREFDGIATAVQLGRTVPEPQLHACLALLRRNTSCLEKLIRGEYHILTADLLRPSIVEQTLRSMQERLIW